MSDGKSIPGLAGRLKEEVDFASQVQFDTLTWGRRNIGQSKLEPEFVVELFELFDGPFVTESFSRRQRVSSTQLGRDIWLPTAEDVVVLKIRWGRSKDLDDARDVLAVQGPESLDMHYIENWCATHGTSTRRRDILDSLPPLYIQLSPESGGCTASASARFLWFPGGRFRLKFPVPAVRWTAINELGNRKWMRIRT